MIYIIYGKLRLLCLMVDAFNQRVNYCPSMTSILDTLGRLAYYYKTGYWRLLYFTLFLKLVCYHESGETFCYINSRDCHRYILKGMIKLPECRFAYCGSASASLICMQMKCPFAYKWRLTCMGLLHTNMELSRNNISSLLVT